METKTLHLAEALKGELRDTRRLAPSSFRYLKVGEDKQPVPVQTEANTLLVFSAQLEVRAYVDRHNPRQMEFARKRATAAVLKELLGDLRDETEAVLMWMVEEGYDYEVTGRVNRLLRLMHGDTVPERP